MAAILKIDDEPNAAALSKLHLRHAGHEPQVTDYGARGLTLDNSVRSDCLILESMLPSQSRLEVCRAPRQEPTTRQTPITMLTSRAANKDRIKGLEFGVDDYVTKAYSVKELVVKVAAILWHRQPLEVAPQRLTLGARKLNSVSQEITIKRRRPERLTTLEFKLISVLACGTVATPPRQKLLSDFWGYALNTDSSTPDSHVRLLRSKLQPLASKVETVQGISYRLVE